MRTTLAEAWPVLSAVGACLALTLAVELPVAAMLGLCSRHELAIIAVANVLTNPLLVWLVIAAAAVAPARFASPGPAYWLFLACLEIGAVIVEWRVLVFALGPPSRRMLWVAAGMNTASFTAGLLLWRLP